jgi:hypothetical protein
MQVLSLAALQTLAKDLWQRIRATLAWRKPRPAIAPGPALSAIAPPSEPDRFTNVRKPEPAPEPALEASKVAPPQPLPGYNRATRRQLERARRRHDKFVTPKGELPARMNGARASVPRPESRAAPEPEPEAPPEVADYHMLIGDKHWADPEGADVLFEESELWGEFNFRDSILDQLDRYWVYLRRMRRIDPDSYGFYRQIGATLLPYSVAGRDRKSEPMTERDKRRRAKLTPWFKEHRPAFGCVAYGADPLTEHRELTEKMEGQPEAGYYVPKFLYFVKYKIPPWQVEPIHGDGDVYGMTVYWDRPHDKKYRRKCGTPQTYPVFVSRDGKVKVLRQLDCIEKEIPVKYRKSRSSNHFFTIPCKGWRIPHTYEEWAQQNGIDVQVYLSNVFIDATQHVEMPNYAMIRVAVHKDDMTAMFTIDPRRASYFFQDRDITIGPHGSRQRIFHMVRAHKRRDGSYVPFHFRGIREFEWAGYHVEITVPGRDHLMLPEVDIGMVHDDQMPKGEKFMTTPQFGKQLTQYMKEGRGGIKKDLA